MLKPFITFYPQPEGRQLPIDLSRPVIDRVEKLVVPNLQTIATYEAISEPKAWPAPRIHAHTSHGHNVGQILSVSTNYSSAISPIAVPAVQRGRNSAANSRA